MGTREWLSGGFLRRRHAHRASVIDMAEIRDLARRASDYEDVPAAPARDGVHRSGFVDVERSATIGEDSRGPVEAGGAADEGGRPAPWSHRWSLIEGGDLTPWMSPEERAAAAQGPAAHQAALPGRPFPFIPSHEYLYDVLAEDGTWRTERDEFMVVEGHAYTPDSWDRGDEPEFEVDATGTWRDRSGERAFEPGDSPTSLPSDHDPADDDLGVWGTAPAEDRLQHISLIDHPQAVEPADIEDAGLLACQDEDRLDASEARREAEWAARERAAEALDRLDRGDRSVEEGAARDDGAVAEEFDHLRPRAADGEWNPHDADPIRNDPEHHFELGFD